jgi:Icc-related predicted phosphoesterase
MGPMHILAVADRRHRALYDYFDPDRWRDIDLVLSCGDLDASYLSFLVTVIHAPLLYVPGNHDERYLKNPPEGCDSVDGVVVKIKGIRVGGLGGSMWYNGRDLQYTEHQMRGRVKKLVRSAKKLGGLDIFISHAPPREIHDLEDQCHRGFDAFRYLMEELRPKIFLHGHNHEIYHQKDRESVVEGVRVINACGYYDLQIDV